MEIENLQKEIDAIDYWDCEVMDFSINYFGDEVKMIVASGNHLENKSNSKQSCYVIRFLLCYQVEYETDANDEKWRKGLEVKNMSRSQLGHYTQQIILKRSQVDDFIEVNLNTSLLFVKIICKDINIQKAEYKHDDFFWSNNRL